MIKLNETVGQQKYKISIKIKIDFLKKELMLDLYFGQFTVQLM